MVSPHGNHFNFSNVTESNGRHTTNFFYINFIYLLVEYSQFTTFKLLD